MRGGTTGEMSRGGEEPGESEGQVHGVGTKWGMENHSCCLSSGPRAFAQPSEEGRSPR